MLNVTSQYGPKHTRSIKPPVVPPVNIPGSSRTTNPPGIWEKLIGGFNNPNITYEEFLDSRLTPEEWSKKHNTTGREYNKWKRDLLLKSKKKPGALQRILQNWLTRSTRGAFRKSRRPRKRK